MSGAVAYVMGPSGAGKDTLLSYARQRLAGSAVVFAHRYITRQPSPDENFVSLSEAEFAARAERGLFAWHWQAHETRYGIGVEIEAWRAKGCTVVVSGSRDHYAHALADDESVTPVLVTASPAIIGDRLRRRGRDSEAQIEERLSRAALFELAHARLRIVRNDGPVEDGGEALVAILRNL
ncbi:MAG: phosphonate metabolism protein/1,5-bisphosphokinase (PRPP-forming) PhnN [Reyranellaceae bacterium]